MHAEKLYLVRKGGNRSWILQWQPRCMRMPSELSTITVYPCLFLLLMAGPLVGSTTLCWYCLIRMFFLIFMWLSGWGIWWLTPDLSLLSITAVRLIGLLSSPNETRGFACSRSCKTRRCQALRRRQCPCSMSQLTASNVWHVLRPFQPHATVVLPSCSKTIYMLKASGHLITVIIINLLAQLRTWACKQRLADWLWIVQA